MVALPNFEVDPTLEAVNSIIEKMEHETYTPRNYLGASAVGGKCERKVYYGLINAPHTPKKAQLIYAARDGHHCEDVIADRLRLIHGIELWTHGEDGKQFEFSDLDGELKGHPDGIVRGLLQAPATLHVWENKSKNQKLFNEFQNTKSKFSEKDTLENWNFEYYVQAQLLMHYFEMSRHYLTVCLAGARDMDSCRTDYNKTFALGQIEKSKRLLSAKKKKIVPERISEFRSFWLCKFCEYADHCWEGHA